jgi:hypothetical protein
MARISSRRAFVRTTAAWLAVAHATQWIGDAAVEGVSVIAPTATEADALSTAFSLMPASRIGDIAAARPGVQVRLITGDGGLCVYGV